MSSFENILVNKKVADGVAHIQLNRPKALNALSPELMMDLKNALIELDNDDSVRAIVVSGNERAFAAGADIKVMAEMNSIEMIIDDLFERWGQLDKTRKPTIAAVSGFALGGGCEVALMCDMIIASDSATFGQPEISIGTIPGAGGTQRLTRTIGKAKAMELILTGRFFDANEALQMGLVNKVVPVELYLDEAINLAKDIAKKSPIAVRFAKESINQALETSLSEGLKQERRNFYYTFASEDQKEGMAAFMEKRKATFKGK